MSVSRITLPLQAVLKALLQQPDAERYGLEIVKAVEGSKLEPPTVYTILLRLRGAGWLSDRWEDQEHARAEHRPPRRYYKLTPEGRTRAINALQRTRDRGSLSRLTRPTTEAGPA